MAENLLNVNAYISQISEQTSTPKKTYVDSASTFDDVFNNANKTYDVDKKFSNASTADKVVDKENFNKVNENKSDKDTPKVKEKDENKLDKDTPKVKEKDENNTQKDEVSKKSDDSESKKEPEEKPKTADNSETVVNDKAATNPVVEAIVSQAMSLLTKVTNTAEQPAESTKATEQAVNANNPEAKLDVDLSKLAQDAKNISADVKNLKAKVQSEVQQVLLNLKTEPEKNVTQVDPNALKNAADVKAQAPLIQANADVAVKADTSSDSKKVLKDILEKTALTQDVLDKTNATVVSVQTLSSSSGNLLNQQNAKEQGVKLSLETIGNNSSDAANIANLNSQVNFDKKLEGAQQPKEINKTDVLSQINSKMEQIKEDGTTRVTIVLKPENLGKINLELINGKDGFTARMTTDNAQVKELLDKNLDSLKSSLSNQGVNVGNVTVKVAETEKQSNEMFSFEQRQPGSEGHQASNNSNNSGDSYGERNSQGYFEEEIVNSAGSGVSEESDSTISHNGKIDYKI